MSFGTIPEDAVEDFLDELCTHPGTKETVVPLEAMHAFLLRLKQPDRPPENDGPYIAEYAVNNFIDQLTASFEEEM